MGRKCTEQHPHKVVKKSLILFGLCFFGASVLSDMAFSEEQLLDKLVAEVAGKAITLSEVQTKVDKGPLIEVSPYPLTETDPPFKVAVNDLINKKLILQKAEELELEVTDETLEQEIKRFLERRNLGREALNAALAQQGMSYDQYKEDFRTQMLINQFEGRELMPQVKVTDRDIQLYYLKNSGSAAQNVKLTLRRLVVTLPAEASDTVKDAKKQVIEKAYLEIQGGMPFEQAVKIYSDDQSARDSGGLMSPLFLKDLAPTIQAGVQDLEEGRFSKPIVLGGSSVIFFVAKREFAGSEDFAKQKPQLEAMLKQEEMGRLLGKWIEAQRRRTPIKILEQ